MARELIGVVTEGERDEILRLHERKMALKELFLSLDSPFLTGTEQANLRSKLLDDLTQTISCYEQWWKTIQPRYGLATRAHGEVMIDFQTREMFFDPNGQPRGDGCDCDNSVMASVSALVPSMDGRGC